MYNTLSNGRRPLASMASQANFIRYSRGNIEIADPVGLSNTACECYAAVKAQYDRLLRPRRKP